MVEADLGHKVAIAIARDLVVFLKRPGGQAQFSAALVLQEKGGALSELLGWMADHLQADLSVGSLAAKACMSERSFARQFRSATGTTPARAVERLRVEAAQQLLADGHAPLKLLAAQCGFPSEEIMRRSFQRQLGVSPLDYRARFGSKYAKLVQS